MVKLLVPDRHRRQSESRGRVEWIDGQHCFQVRARQLLVAELEIELGEPEPERDLGRSTLEGGQMGLEKGKRVPGTALFDHQLGSQPDRFGLGGIGLGCLLEVFQRPHRIRHPAKLEDSGAGPVLRLGVRLLAVDRLLFHRRRRALEVLALLGQVLDQLQGLGHRRPELETAVERLLNLGGGVDLIPGKGLGDQQRKAGCRLRVPLL